MTDEITRLFDAAPVSLLERPGMSHVRVDIAVTMLLRYVAVVRAVTMSPAPLGLACASSIDEARDALHCNGIPEWFGYSRLEFTANARMFVSVGFAVGLALPTRIAWSGLFMPLAFSGAIALTQSATLLRRSATVEYVIANSSGGWIGSLVDFTVRATVKDQKVIAQVEWDAQHDRDGRAK